MKFIAITTYLVAAACALVPLTSAEEVLPGAVIAKRATLTSNGDMIARGLPPLKPRTLFQDRLHRALKPRASPLPPPARDLIQPGGSCGCTYTVYASYSGDGTYSPDSDVPVFTSSPETLQSCEVICDNRFDCSYASFDGGVCNIYASPPTAPLVPAPLGFVGLLYNVNTQCSGTCAV